MQVIQADQKLAKVSKGNYFTFGRKNVKISEGKENGSGTKSITFTGFEV